MNPDLAAALAPVLADWRAAGMAEPRITDGSGSWADEPGWARVMTWWPAGDGAGVQIRLDATPAERIVEAAEYFQEPAIESLPSRGLPTNWPPCPAHPTTHPLRPAVVDGAVWTCPVDGAVFARIGG